VVGLGIRRAIALTAAANALAATGCGADDAQDKANDVRDKAKDTAQQIQEQASELQKGVGEAVALDVGGRHGAAHL
jgi:hypothetical protein